MQRPMYHHIASQEREDTSRSSKAQPLRPYFLYWLIEAMLPEMHATPNEHKPAHHDKCDIINKIEHFTSVSSFQRVFLIFTCRSISCERSRSLYGRVRSRSWLPG